MLMDMILHPDQNRLFIEVCFLNLYASILSTTMALLEGIIRNYNHICTELQ